MIKDSIAYYTPARVPLSLGNLMLHSGKFVEDIFDAVEDSEDFAELTDALYGIIANTMTIDRVTDRYVRYIVKDGFGGHNFLKIKIKEKENVQ